MRSALTAGLLNIVNRHFYSVLLKELLYFCSSPPPSVLHPRGVAQRFFDHAKSEDWLCHRLVKNWQPNEARVQIPIRSTSVWSAFPVSDILTNDMQELARRELPTATGLHNPENLTTRLARGTVGLLFAPRRTGRPARQLHP